MIRSDRGTEQSHSSSLHPMGTKRCCRRRLFGRQFISRPRVVASSRRMALYRKDTQSATIAPTWIQSISRLIKSIPSASPFISREFIRRELQIVSNKQLFPRSSYFTPFKLMLWCQISSINRTELSNQDARHLPYIKFLSRSREGGVDGATGLHALKFNEPNQPEETS